MAAAGGGAALEAAHTDCTTAGRAEVQLARADAAVVAWRKTRYWRWQEEQQHAEPGLRPALLRLALASLGRERRSCRATWSAWSVPW